MGNSTSTLYDAVGNALLVTDALGAVTKNVYDARNRLVQKTRPMPNSAQAAPVTTYQYDPAGNLLSMTDPLGHTTWYQYDRLNRQIAVTDALGSFSGDPQHTTVTRYDCLGNVAAVTDPLGHVTQYYYDNLNRQISEEHDLAAYWKLDEQSGTTVSDSSGNAQDGQVVGGAAWTESGKSGGAIVLDGYDDYLKAATPGGSLLSYNGEGGLTLSTWLYIDPAQTTNVVLLTRAGYPYWLQLTADHKIEFRLNYFTQGQNRAITSPQALSTGVWHQVAATVDESKHMVLYIDGVEMASGDHAITQWPTEDPSGTYYMTIGTASIYSQPGIGPFFHGKLDDVRIYKRALSADEVADIRASKTYSYDAVGNLTASADAAGHVTQYYYDNLNRQISEECATWRPIGNWTSKAERSSPTPAATDTSGGLGLARMRPRGPATGSLAGRCCSTAWTTTCE